MRSVAFANIFIGLIVLVSIPAQSLTLEELAERVEQLGRENQALRREVEALRQQLPANHVVSEDISPVREQASKQVETTPLLTIDHLYSYEMLDPTTNRSRKQEYLLQQKQNGELHGNSVVLGGAITAIAGYQRSDTESKFGYLMRHPTASNQRTKTVSEAVLHSAQVQLTANLGDWVTTYLEFLYNPEQSFGAGTITDLNRNQVQVRRGYVLFGDLGNSPFYLSLGKMDTPFGLMDTPNPFTASTVWHAFGGLAYGLLGGYRGDNINVRLMAVQGGAQFRAANVPVDNTNIPSKLNNFAGDINYRITLGENNTGLFGVSYTKGSAYCQEFPVTHFSACEEENGAYDLYTRFTRGNLMIQAEYARTEDIWPGTFNPDIPEFSASKVTSWDIGGKYRSRIFDYPVDFSADFSRFDAGPDGAPWEKQDQIVLGVAGFLGSSVKLFGELIHVDGYAPLNFISGGNMAPGQTHSDLGSETNILMLGTNMAF